MSSEASSVLHTSLYLLGGRCGGAHGAGLVGVRLFPGGLSSGWDLPGVAYS